MGAHALCFSAHLRYAIGALATGQLTYAQTQLHKKVVLDVAMSGKSLGKSTLRRAEGMSAAHEVRL